MILPGIRWLLFLFNRNPCKYGFHRLCPVTTSILSELSGQWVDQPEQTIAYLDCCFEYRPLKVLHGWECVPPGEGE